MHAELCVVVLFAAGSSVAVAKPTPQRVAHSCYEASITNSPSDSEGEIIKADDGHIYEVDDVNRSDSALWLPTDELIVCCDRFLYKGSIVTLYTLRSDSDKVDARRLR